MQKFTQLHAVPAPLGLANIDTDMIISAHYMKGLTRVGMGQHLFKLLRYTADGREQPDFILNHPICRKAQILIADRNFGCGSSREHAVWALTNFGIRCVIAPSFGDIFSNNARKNGLLLIRLPAATCDQLRQFAASSQYAPMTVDLIAQTIQLSSGDRVDFEIDEVDRHNLVHGLDDIARTLRHAGALQAFETRT